MSIFSPAGSVHETISVSEGTDSNADLERPYFVDLRRSPFFPCDLRGKSSVESALLWFVCSHDQKIKFCLILFYYVICNSYIQLLRLYVMEIGEIVVIIGLYTIIFLNRFRKPLTNPPSAHTLSYPRNSVWQTSPLRHLLN